MTISELKQTDASFRNKTDPGSLTQQELADQLDAMCEEVRVRGILEASSTAALPAISYTDTRKVWIDSIGLFVYATGLVVDNVTVFAEASGGMWKLSIDLVTLSKNIDTVSYIATGNEGSTISMAVLADKQILALFRPFPLTPVTDPLAALSEQQYRRTPNVNGAALFEFLNPMGVDELVFFIFKI